MFHHLLPHWMDLSTWEDIWTSTLVTSVFTIPAVIISHIKRSRKMEDLMNPNTPGGLGELNRQGKSDEQT